MQEKRYMYLYYHGHRVKLLGAQMESNLLPSENGLDAKDIATVFVVHNIDSYFN